MCTNSNSYNSRIETLDIYKGFLIFLVVWGHFMMPLIDREYLVARRLFLLIYSFHMPAFIFLSGYFYYSSWKKRGTGFKSICSWIVLYCAMKLMLNCSDILFYGEKKLITNFLHESYAPWYILVMIIFKLLLLPIEFIQKINKKDIGTNIYLILLIIFGACLSMLICLGRRKYLTFWLWTGWYLLHLSFIWECFIKSTFHPEEFRYLKRQVNRFL